MSKHEERIGVKIPGQGYYMLTVMVGTLDSDEEVLSRITKKVGSVFNVSGVKYELVKSEPYTLLRLPSEDDEEPAPRKPVQATRKSEPPESTKRVSLPPGPAVGEVWKPRDPRRIASFTVVAIKDDHVVTDDGRQIQLARFPRYERVSVASPARDRSG